MQGNALISLKWLVSVSGQQRKLLLIATLCTLLQVIFGLIPALIIFALIEGLVANTLTYSYAMLLAALAVSCILLRYGLFFAAALLSHHAAFRLVAEIKGPIIQTFVTTAHRIF